MTAKEAGSLGGEKILRERGAGYFAKLGKKGGAAIRDRRGREYMIQLAKRAGAKSKERGSAFFGRMGGEKLLRERGRE